MNFIETLDEHLEAIQTRNLEAFIKTVCLDEIVLILPTGTFIQSGEEFLEMHRGWFGDLDWEMKAKVIHTIETEELCSALLDVQYRDLDEIGQVIEMSYFLHLIFKEKEGKWLLVHDQNTVYEK